MKNNLTGEEMLEDKLISQIHLVKSRQEVFGKGRPNLKKNPRFITGSLRQLATAQSFLFVQRATKTPVTTLWFPSREACGVGFWVLALL